MFSITKVTNISNIHKHFAIFFFATPDKRHELSQFQAMITCAPSKQSAQVIILLLSMLNIYFLLVYQFIIHIIACYVQAALQF